MGTPKAISPSLEAPAIDEHVVAEGCRLELIDGQPVVTPPAQEPHGRKHSELDYLLRAHVAADFLVAVDMLTRAAHDQDFAPEVSVYPRQRDENGRRKLDELSFEIVDQQSMGVPTRKAEVLSARGVRRLFAVDVEEGAVYEWDAALSVWSYLERSSLLTDRCFVRPLPVAAILDAAEADDAVFDALRAKGNAALMDFAQASFDKGQVRGQLVAKREAVYDLCEVLSVALTDAQRAHIEAADLPALSALVQSLKDLKRWP